MIAIFEYPGDGWGLTHDENPLIMSDGYKELRFLDLETFAELGRLEVFDGNAPVAYLNELEFVEGKIYANVQARSNRDYSTGFWPKVFQIRLKPQPLGTQ